MRPAAPLGTRAAFVGKASAREPRLDARRIDLDVEAPRARALEQNEARTTGRTLLVVLEACEERGRCERCARTQLDEARGHTPRAKERLDALAKTLRSEHAELLARSQRHRDADADRDAVRDRAEARGVLDRVRERVTEVERLAV